MGLPLYIHISEDPPLTTSRRGMQQTLYALNSPGGDGGGGGGSTLDGLDTSGLLSSDWMASLFTPNEDGAAPSPLNNPLLRSAGGGGGGGFAVPSPRRAATTRAAGMAGGLREATTPKPSPRPLGSALRPGRAGSGGLGNLSVAAPSPSNAAVKVTDQYMPSPCSIALR